MGIVYIFLKLKDSSKRSKGEKRKKLIDFFDFSNLHFN